MPILGPALVVTTLWATANEDPPPDRRRSPVETLATTSLQRTTGIPTRSLLDPALIRGPDGLPALAFLAYELGRGDVLTVQSLAEGAQPLELTDPGQLFRPVGVQSARAKPQLFWTELVNEQPRLRTARWNGSWAPPAWLETGEGAALNPDCVVDASGRVWLAWQQFHRGEDQARGGYDLFVAQVDDSRLRQVRQITQDFWSDWDPVLAAGDDGSVWLAWVRFSGRDYETFVARFPADGAMEGPWNVSRDSASDDFHVDVAVAPDGAAWLAWDRVLQPHRGTSWSKDPELDEDDGTEASEISLQVARVHHGEITVTRNPEHPGRVPSEIPYSQNGGSPKLAFGSRGELHLVSRCLDRRPKRVMGRGLYGYPLVHQVYENGQWSDPRKWEDSEGTPSEPRMMSVDGGLWVVGDRNQAHGVQGLKLPPRLPEATWKTVKSLGVELRGDVGPFQIALGFVPHATKDGSESIVDLPTTEPPPGRLDPRTHPLGNVEANPYLTGEAHHQVHRGEESYRVFYGDLHRHSSVSRCSHGREPSPDVRYRFGADACLYDFYALTDHSGHFEATQWWGLSKRVDLYRTPAFCTLQGYEWASGFAGHMNVILRERVDQVLSTSLADMSSPTDLWRRLTPGDALTIPHHPAHRRMPIQWGNHDPRFQKLVEVYQASRGSYEFAGAFRQAKTATFDGSFVHDGLEQGLRLGLIASTDHGNGAAYAAVLAPQLDRESIFQALSARRTFASTTKGILMDFRIDGRLMGEELSADGPVELSLDVLGTEEIAEAVVFRNGEEIWQWGRPTALPEEPRSYTLEVRFERRRNRPLSQDFQLEVRTDHGTFQPFGSRRWPSTSSGDPGWAPREDDHVVWIHPAPYRGEVHPHQRKVRVTQRGAQQIIVTVADALHTVSLEKLRRKPLRIRDPAYTLTVGLYGALDCSVDPARGTGDQEIHETWTDDPPPGSSWYYARIIQTNTEMAWSSPLFVDRPKPEKPDNRDKRRR